MPVLALRQQDPGNKGPQRHRQTQRIHKQRRAQHQQQRSGGKDFAHARRSDVTEDRPQQIASAYQHAGKRQYFHADLHPVDMTAVGSGQQRDQRQGWDHRDILKQQHRKAQLPRFAAVHAFIHHQLQGHGGRGHRQTNPANDRRLPAKVGQP